MMSRLNKTRYLSVCSIFLLLLLTRSANMQPSHNSSSNQILSDDLVWADSVMQKMSLDDKIGQLFMVRAQSDKGKDHINEIKNLINEHHIGGLCFFQGTPERQVELTNEYQKLSTLPLMISMDAEWGASMRFKTGVISYPKQMTLGALQDNRLIFQFGQEVAKELLRLGVHINFAPVIDINTNMANPVIGNRSFSENKYVVSQKAYMYMLGLQSMGVMACAKHFPGHGDTNIDSHHDVPMLKFDTTRLMSQELYPFEVLIKQGIQSVMIGHLVVPALEPTPNVPASLSEKIIDGWLKTKLGFNGLVFTDALDMKGVTKNFAKGEIEVKALQAGVDVLLLSEDVPLSINSIKAAIRKGTLHTSRIDESVRKILAAKYKFGLTKTPKISLTNLEKDLNKGSGKAIKQKIIEQAITLVKNDGNLLPVANLKINIGSLAIGASSKVPFQSQIDDYTKADHFFVQGSISDNDRNSLVTNLSKKDLVIVGVLGIGNALSNNFKIPPGTVDLINQLSKETKVVLIAYGTPYSLKNFSQPQSVLCAYNDDEVSQVLAIQSVFGGIPFRGRLPVTAGEFPFESGIITSKPIRISFGEPESVGMNAETLQKLDKMAEELIRREASPGCEMVVIKDGKVVYNKAFGKYTYQSNTRASTSTIYDLASITKVAATTLAAMKLYQEGKMDIFKPLGFYIPELKNSNKEFMIIRDVMAHRSGLYPWIPFYKETLTDDGNRVRPSSKIYQSRKSDQFGIRVANRLYMDNNYISTVWNQLINCQNLPNTDYRYSDLGMIMMRKVMENITNMPMNEYLDQTFYSPMGLRTMTFLPLSKFPVNRMAPSEDDRYFRQQVLQGDVHDMGAAMFGGVSGHAGLFSNALDLGVLFQMLLNYGSYGGQEYIRPDIIRLFTTRHPSDTRRGIGFDMPQLDWSATQNVTSKASRETFGHIGFTGTAVWADPKNKMIFVFLSNRTYPYSKNNKLERLNYRMKGHAIVYEAMADYNYYRLENALSGQFVSNQ